MSAVHKVRGRAVVVNSLADFDDRIDSGATSMAGWRLQSIDLTERGPVLASADVAGALFLGCSLPPGALRVLQNRGATIFPELTGSPIEPWRSGLYVPYDLYDTSEYADSLDARTYAWSQQPEDPESALAEALHDHAIDTALEEWAEGRSLVGVMGGHSLKRGEPAYREAAELGRLLSQHSVVATGGGPGAMEAANLGAWLSQRDPEELSEAIDLLATVPGFQPLVGAWVETAMRVYAKYADGPATDNLGIPTWHYGHEPPNPFATVIAKYFRNATREAVLLQVCDRGIVFLPGAAGTVQEVFQDACENYYADESSLSHMVLLGKRYWTEELPAWPLLKTLARGRAMESKIHLVDSVAEAVHIVAVSGDADAG